MGKEKRFISLKYQIIGFVSAIVISIAVIYGVFSVYQIHKLSDTGIEKYDQAMEDGYKTEIKSQVQSAMSVIQSYYNQYKEGSITEEEAKNLAKEAVRGMRYRDDDSGYIWIDGTDYILVMHPILTDQEGQNRKDLKDQEGVMVTQEVVKAAQSGGAYNSFHFTKADGKTVAPKLAYAEEFKEWGWAVATGNYVDEMQAEMEENNSILTKAYKSSIVKLALMSVVMLFITAGAAVVVGSKISTPISRLEKSLEQIAEGNLKSQADTKYTKRGDEIGKISRALVSVHSSLNSMVGSINSLAVRLGNDNKSFGSYFDTLAENIGSINQAVEDIAQGAASQASDTETVSNQVKELEHVIDKENSSVVQLEQAVSSMTEYSGSAVDNIEKLSNISVKTNHAIEFVNSQTQETNNSVANIQRAIDVITNIAEQTSLLSLNASIEAARAGEQGKGFAVVAEEIRKLADESNKSASEINDAVNQLISNSGLSVEKMEDVSENVLEQTRCLKDTKEAFENLYKEIKSVEEVSGSISVQTEKLSELKTAVSDSINSLASVVEQNAASAEETSASINLLNEGIYGSKKNLDELAALNTNLTEEIGRFNI
ncbi:MAG: cache domain-containing protein [Lachnospiraceae bacterium]